MSEGEESKDCYSCCTLGHHRWTAWTEFVAQGRIWIGRQCQCTKCNKIEEKGIDVSDRQAEGNSGSGVTWGSQRTLTSTEASQSSNTTNTGAFTFTNANPDLGELLPRSLPRRKSEEAFRGYKHAFVSPEFPKFRGISWPTWYGVDDWAIHEGCKGIVKCVCGFYAYNKEYCKWHEWLSVRNYGSLRAFLEVELYGTVIVHELGYRAQRQRILRVWVSDDFLPGMDLSSWYGTEIRRWSKMGGIWKSEV